MRKRMLWVGLAVVFAVGLVMGISTTFREQWVARLQGEPFVAQRPLRHWLRWAQHPDDDTLATLADTELPQVVDLVFRWGDEAELQSLRTWLSARPQWHAKVKPYLLDLLDHPEAFRREAAAQLLGQLQPPPNDALAKLLEHARQDEQARVRHAAMTAIVSMRPPAPLGIVSLAEFAHSHQCAADDRTFLQQQMITHLEAILPILLDQLTLSDPWTFAIAQSAPRRALPWIRPELRHRNPAIRLPAALLVLEVEPDDHDAIAVILEVLRDPTNNEVAVQKAQQAVRRIPPAKVLPALIEQLQTSDPALVHTALDTLAGLGPRARPAWLIIAKQMEADTTYRYDLRRAITVAEQLAPEATEVIASLLPWAGYVGNPVTDTTGRVAAAWQAVEVLLRFGPKLRPHLSAALASEHLATRLGAIRTLGLWPESQQAEVEQLLALLTQEPADVRAEAAQALGQLPIAAPRAIPHLIQAVNDRQVRVRLLAIAALGKLGVGDPQVQAALKPLVRESYHSKNVDAMLLGPTATLPIVRDPWLRVQWAAAIALSRVDPSFTDTVPILLKVLARGERPEKIEAAEALARLGPAAKEATAYLHAQLRLLGPWDPLREVYQRTLEKITSPPPAPAPTPGP